MRNEEEIMREIRVVLIALAIVAMSAAAFGQATTAAVRGRVVNDAGNAIANAEINAVNTASGFVQTVKGGRNGAYTLAGLTPGPYSIVDPAPGYEPQSQAV